MAQREFPPDFIWGAATSSYQIEGAAHEGGRSESIWDRFSYTPGKIKDGSSGDIACDHYHRWRDDIALMRDLGLHAYRFSIAWPRILAEGRGRVNQAGLDFYSSLVDGLLEVGITPYATLYHWDLPQVLQDEGGWPARATAEAFAEYGDVVSRHLGDRVKHWITHNEPWCASMLGYWKGEHAPGKHDLPAALAASHHLLLSHGLAVQVLRRNCPDAEVGITLNFEPTLPASASLADREAARHHDGWFNRWFIDPLFGRGYPGDIVADYRLTGKLPAGELPWLQPGDLEAIAAPLDFLGVNYYARNVARADVPPHENLPPTVHKAPPSEWTDIGWEVYPDGLYQLLMRLTFEYQVPKLLITENGAAYNEGPDDRGRVHDERRRLYLRDHFRAAHRALQAGAPLAGYFVWSLMDNFEWAWGYTQRFGIVWVDYETQERIPKDSALWYKQVIADNGFSDDQ